MTLASADRGDKLRPMIVAGIAVLLSFLLFLAVLAVLVLVRRGDAPSRRTSREYDASRREAVRLLTGAESAPATSRSWTRRAGSAGDGPLEAPFRSALAEALRVAVPGDRGLVVEPDGTARLAGDARIVAAVSTAGLRARGPGEGDGLSIGLVLVDPEPPGADPAWVALPVQVLFPALERAGRTDLVERLEGLARRLA
ncbi:MAG TPA: hypothetical protein VJP59_08050 [Gemmatimonadota bacterium]|nr:hypothetical protein [Gemmatimonadota bacterium]